MNIHDSTKESENEYDFNVKKVLFNFIFRLCYTLSVIIAIFISPIYGIVGVSYYIALSTFILLYINYRYKS